jgi:hypothetical protein
MLGDDAVAWYWTRAIHDDKVILRNANGFVHVVVVFSIRQSVAFRRVTAHKP